MKPNFALTLSFDGIGLLHRTFPGWHLVGEVALDAEDLTGALSVLRDTAAALDPSGVRSKLTIPNDQIKYLSIDTGSASDAEVRDALEGATPYAVDDLAYDWVSDNGHTQIAAVAHETLAEAEAFALEHNFSPMSFVAIPDETEFSGEPFFGTTDHAREILSDGEDVERDSVAIRIVGASSLPELEDKSPEDDAEDADVETPEQAISEGDEDVDDKPVTPFSSIRAHRSGEIPTDAPRLEGAARLSGLDNATFTPTKSAPRTPDKGMPEDISLTDLPNAVAEAGAELASGSDANLEIPEVDAAPKKPVAFLSGRKPISATANPNSEKSKRKVSKPASKSVSKSKREDEKQRMTVFGAREQQIGGKPRFLGLILTAVLMLFLVGVAAWASIFLDEGLARFFGSPKDINVADVSAVPEIEDADDVIVALPAEDEVLVTEADEPTEIASLDVEIPEDVTPNTAFAVVPEELSPSEALARYAATGIWQIAPLAPQSPGSTGVEAVYQASLDRSLLFEDASALPSTNSVLLDVRPSTPADPPAPDTLFDYDERGFVRATPDGAMTPEGVLVFTGPPPLVPPIIPPRASAALGPADTAELARLAAFRPRVRPIIPEEPDATSETGAEVNNPQLAALRPRVRPDSIQPPAETDNTETETETETVDVDTDAVNEALANATEAEVDVPLDPDLFDNPTAQAVTASLTPTDRPSNFAEIVKKTREASAQTAVAVTQVLAPDIPSKTSVAKQATQRNVLNLRAVNLIGVYGAPDSRRALVRLANGRYKKVKIGDRLDGGKVAAIGTSELSYVKKGRAVVLKMPKG